MLINNIYSEDAYMRIFKKRPDEQSVKNFAASTKTTAVPNTRHGCNHTLSVTAQRRYEAANIVAKNE